MDYLREAFICAVLPARPAGRKTNARATDVPAAMNGIGRSRSASCSNLDYNVEVEVGRTRLAEARSLSRGCRRAVPSGEQPREAPQIPARGWTARSRSATPAGSGWSAPQRGRRGPRTRSTAGPTERGTGRNDKCLAARARSSSGARLPRRPGRPDRARDPWARSARTAAHPGRRCSSFPCANRHRCRAVQGHETRPDRRRGAALLSLVAAGVAPALPAAPGGRPVRGLDGSARHRGPPGGRAGLGDDADQEPGC